MAFNPAPSAWLGAGYSLAANAITLNTADAATDATLLELTDVEANATTGDIRAVFHGLSEGMFAAWLAQATADRPQQVSITRVISGRPDGKVNYQYNLNFVMDANVEVAPEPA